MKVFNILQFILFFSATLVNADRWVAFKHNYYAAAGCKLAVDKYANYCGKAEAAKKYKCICSNKYAITSWAYCSYLLDPNDEDNVNRQIVDLCSSSANLTTSQISNYYNDYKDLIVDIDNDSDYNSTKPKFPIYGESVQKYAHSYYISYKHRYGNLSTAHYMGIAFISTVGFVIICAGLINWSMRLSNKFSNSFNNKFSNFFRKNLTLGLIGKNHLHLNKLKGLNPDRVEAFFIFIMFLYSILCCTIIGFKYEKNDPVFATYQAGTSRYWGDRSIILVSYQLPLLFILPGRNNFFQLITRWKYSRFVTFHKWLGRIIFMEALIHGCSMASQTYALSKFTRFHTSWYREGITALVSFAFIIIFAGNPIRRHWYEFFICAHVILAVMFLWTAWRHAHSQDYQDFYWACAAIWIFDTLIRGIRILINGGPKTAEIELFPGEDVLKITVEETKFLKPKPGSHSFIHFLTPLRFWQSHPFTVYPSEVKPGFVTYTCRVKKGMTKFIADKCRSNNDLKISMKICIDGYYGEQSSYQYYDKSVFITGGTGIAGPYYHIKKLIENNSNREVKLYWSIRTYDCIKWFVPELLSLKNTQVKPVIFISQPDSTINGSTSSSDETEKKSSDDNNDEENKDNNNILESLDFVEIKHGRLNVNEIVTSEISNSSGSVAFGACAHTQVVDEVRRTVANNLNLSNNKVEYFEEMQVW